MTVSKSPSITSLSQALRCPPGLAFSLQDQACDWKQNVVDCHLKVRDKAHTNWLSALVSYYVCSIAQKVIRTLCCSAVDCAHIAISTVLRPPIWRENVTQIEIVNRCQYAWQSPTNNPLSMIVSVATRFCQFLFPRHHDVYFQSLWTKNGNLSSPIWLASGSHLDPTFLNRVSIKWVISIVTLWNCPFKTKCVAIDMFLLRCVVSHSTVQKSTLQSAHSGFVPKDR